MSTDIDKTSALAEQRDVYAQNLLIENNLRFIKKLHMNCGAHKQVDRGAKSIMKVI